MYFYLRVDYSLEANSIMTFKDPHHYLCVKNLYEHFLDGIKLTIFILSLQPSRKHTYPCKQLGELIIICVRITCISKIRDCCVSSWSRSPKAEIEEQTEMQNTGQSSYLQATYISQLCG